MYPDRIEDMLHEVVDGRVGRIFGRRNARSLNMSMSTVTGI